MTVGWWRDRVSRRLGCSYVVSVVVVERGNRRKEVGRDWGATEKALDRDERHNCQRAATQTRVHRIHTRIAHWDWTDIQYLQKPAACGSVQPKFSIFVRAQHSRKPCVSDPRLHPLESHAPLSACAHWPPPSPQHPESQRWRGGPRSPDGSDLHLCCLPESIQEHP